MVLTILVDCEMLQQCTVGTVVWIDNLFTTVFFYFCHPGKDSISIMFLMASYLNRLGSVVLGFEYEKGLNLIVYIIIAKKILIWKIVMKFFFQLPYEIFSFLTFSCCYLLTVGIGSPMHQSSRRPINLWSNSNTQQQNPSSGMMWPNSPSHINSIPTQRPPVTVFSRAPPIMVNMASSPVHHHIGSAPVLNSPFWDRRQAYVAESLESSGFHIGSHGSMGIPGSSPSHPMDIGSHKTFSVGGNRMDVNSQNAVLRSPQQLSHLFPGRSPMGSMPGSFDSPNERYRNLSHRRSESSSSNADKKLYELDVDRILRGEDRRTTLMIKNIPNKYVNSVSLFYFSCLYLLQLFIVCVFS